MAINNLKTPFFLDRKNEARKIISLSDIKASQPITIGTTEHPAGTSLDSLLANADARPYKVYTASLSQDGTSAPVAVVLENTLGVTLTWSRFGVGNYRLTASSAIFDVNKMMATVTSMNDAQTYHGFYHNGVNTYIGLYQFSSPSDGWSEIIIDIKIYN
jgi:hypothetical protein